MSAEPQESTRAAWDGRRTTTVRAWPRPRPGHGVGEACARAVVVSSPAHAALVRPAAGGLQLGAHLPHLLVGLAQALAQLRSLPRVVLTGRQARLQRSALLGRRGEAQLELAELALQLPGGLLGLTPASDVGLLGQLRPPRPARGEHGRIDQRAVHLGRVGLRTQGGRRQADRQRRGRSSTPPGAARARRGPRRRRERAGSRARHGRRRRTSRAGSRCGAVGRARAARARARPGSGGGPSHAPATRSSTARRSVGSTSTASMRSPAASAEREPGSSMAAQARPVPGHNRALLGTAGTTTMTAAIRRSC